MASPEAIERFQQGAKALPKAVADIVWPKAQILRVRQGQMIVTWGSVSDEVYVVLSGRVQVTLFGASGREVIIRDIAAGDMFGEIAAIDRRPRSATVVASEDGVVASIPGHVFRGALDFAPGAGMWIGSRFAQQVRALTDKIFELSALAVRSRLHCELLRLAGGARRTETGLVIDCAPTHAEFAARIGSHREAVTREFKHLAGAGIIRQQQRQLTIMDIDRLTDEVRRVAGEHPA